jgi:hypothetical protein
MSISGYLAAREKLDIHREKQKQESKEKYLQNANICKNCGVVIPYEKRKSCLLFCGHSCAATYSNLRRERKSNRSGQQQEADCTPSQLPASKIECVKKQYYCLSCKSLLLSSTAFKYCSSACQRDLRKKKLLDKLDRGIVDGIHIGKIRQYLIDKRGAKCVNCGWDKINPVTGKCPIELEHIDGNSENNKLDNLCLLCPSCHSLTPTYKSLNKGMGRHKRKIRYKEGKSY